MRWEFMNNARNLQKKPFHDVPYKKLTKQKQHHKQTELGSNGIPR